MPLDKRIAGLSAWQRAVYDLCNACGISNDKKAGKELDRMKKERPKEYERAFKVWRDVMAEILYD